MTFTFDEALTADRDKVRHHIGDTDSARAWFTDEHIAGIITLEGTWQKAVVSCLRNMIVRLSSEPTMRADWLQTDYATALRGLEALLKAKLAEFGLPSGMGITSALVQSYRPDSNQTGAIDYDD